MAKNELYYGDNLDILRKKIPSARVAEILAGKRLDLPMARTDTVKAATRQGDADKQMGLL